MDKPISYDDSGAFKRVEIYEKHVVKSLKDNFDSEDYDYDSGDTSYDEQIEEIDREVQMMKRYKHLAIIPKLLWEDNESFAAERVYKISEHPYYDDDFNKRNKAKAKIIYKAIYKKVIVYGMKTSLKYIENHHRIKGMVTCGIYHKLPVSNIVEDIATFMRLDKSTGLLQDMHSSNYGVKNGHIVAIDLGQVRDYNLGRKSVKTRDKIRSFRDKVSKELELDYVKLLGAKEGKRMVYLQRKNNKVILGKIDRVEVFARSLRVYFDNDYMSITADGWRVA